MSFSPAALLKILAQFPHAPRHIVAYSGGMDSHVLLHALAQLRPELPGVELRVVHVDHRLHQDSADWAQHCMRVCAQLGIACDVRVVDARASAGTSPEAAARMARYSAFTEVVQPGDMLFTAHHQDDQAETLLLQLLRGTGPRGWAGMAELSRFGTAWLARPLLEFSRAVLHEYALAHQLSWIDDPSNVDTRFNRNYLRHEIMPRLQRRWPAANVTLARGAQHAAETAELLEELAKVDFQSVRKHKTESTAGDWPLPPGRGKAGDCMRPPWMAEGRATQGAGCRDAGGRATQEQLPKMGVVHMTDPHPALPPSRGKEFFVSPLPATTPSAARPPLLENEEGRQELSLLSVSKLLALSPARQRNVLRFWIERAGLPMPHQRHLERLQSEVLHAAADAEPCLHWPGAEVRRYRDTLVALPPLPPFDAARQWEWNLQAPLHIAGVGTLTAHQTQGAGLRPYVCADGVQIAFRSGGERIQPAGRAHHATLKNLFQQAGVWPWLRERVPLLYIHGELAAVAGYWYAQEFFAPADAVAIEFQPE